MRGTARTRQSDSGLIGYCTDRCLRIYSLDRSQAKKHYSAALREAKKTNLEVPMTWRPLLGLTVFAAALPALAATSCPPPYGTAGSNCTFTAALGWLAAGQGTATIITIYVPPRASGPVDFEITGLSSSLGTSYTGYLGIMASGVGQPGGKVVTLSDIVASGPNSIGPVHPGQLIQFQIAQVCWDPTCTQAAPANAVPIMFGLQLVMSSPVSGDLDVTPAPRANIQFLSGSRVTFETQVAAQASNSLFSIIPGISIGATPAGRYVQTGSAFNLPFDAVSISNVNNPNPITGTAILQDLNGNTVAKATIPAIPPGGAAGFLVIGRTPGDPIGLFPSSTVLPATPDGIFHGTLIVGMTGLSAAAFNIVAAQEYNGNAMLNLPVLHSPVL
jgi:hypothetical protein